MQGRKLGVGFLLMHNFTLTAFASFVDVLRLAADEGDRSRPILCTWQVMSADRGAARSSCGVEVQPTAGMTDPAAFDYVVVVGGLLQGTPALPAAAASFLRRAATAGVPLVGVCTGSFVLCRLGLMAGRKCCVSWYHYRDFVDEFPALVPVADRLFVVDGDRITCSGGAGVATLAARLVGERLGPAAAQKALDILLVGPLRSGDSAQPAPTFDIAAANDDGRVSRALLLMEQHIGRPVPVAAIAERVCIGVRQLERLFEARLGTSPQHAYLTLRLKHGRWMLAHTTLSAARIAAETGFSDGSHFGRAFRASYGSTPAAFRRSARAGLGATDEPRRVFE